MFKVTFVKTIFDAQEPSSNVRFVALSREEQVPFAPTIGQEFFWATERAQKVLAVTWNFADSSFTCKVEDEFPDELNLDGLDFDELLEDAPSRGWRIVRVFEAT